MSNVQEALNNTLVMLDALKVEFGISGLEPLIAECKVALAEIEKCEPVFTNINHGFVMTDRNFTYAGNGYIQDNNFDHDAALKISGDFAEGDLDKYAQMIVKQLNTKG